MTDPEIDWQARYEALRRDMNRAINRAELRARRKAELLIDRVNRCPAASHTLEQWQSVPLLEFESLSAHVAEDMFGLLLVLRMRRDIESDRLIRDTAILREALERIRKESPMARTWLESALCGTAIVALEQAT